MAVTQTSIQKAGASFVSVEVAAASGSNGFFRDMGGWFLGVGTGSPNAIFKYQKPADLAMTNNVYNGVPAGSIWIRQEDGETTDGQIYFNNGGTSGTSTTWTVIGTNAS